MNKKELTITDGVNKLEFIPTIPYKFEDILIDVFDTDGNNVYALDINEAKQLRDYLIEVLGNE